MPGSKQSLEKCGESKTNVGGLLRMTLALSLLVLQFEEGKLGKEAIYEMFNTLVVTGDIWSLPTDYLDKAAMLLQSHLIGPEAAEAKLRGMHS